MKCFNSTVKPRILESSSSSSLIKI